MCAFLYFCSSIIDILSRVSFLTMWVDATNFFYSSSTNTCKTVRLLHRILLSTTLPLCCFLFFYFPMKNCKYTTLERLKPNVRLKSPACHGVYLSATSTNSVFTTIPRFHSILCCVCITTCSL